MLAKLLVEFASYLRTNKIMVPTSSVYELTDVLPYVEVTNRHIFKETLKQTWIKDKDQFETYETAFSNFFIKDIKEHVSYIQHKDQLDTFNQSLHQLTKQQVSKHSGNEGEAVQQMSKLLTNASPSLAKEAFEMQLNNELSSDLPKAKDLLEYVTEKSINSLFEDLIWEAINMESPSIIFDALNEYRDNLFQLQKEVLKIKEKELEYLSEHEKTVHSGLREMIETEVDKLMDKNINTLSKQDISLLRDTINRQSVHLMTKFSNLLRQVSKEADIDMKRTVSESIKTFGIPMRLFYQNLKKKKTKIDIILDVSGSVVKSAEFMTLFAYLMFNQFPNQVRVFTFVGLLDDTTHFLQSSDIHEAIANTLTNASVDYRGYSDYGRALSMYERHHMSSVDKNTIVFFLGDARNNKNMAREDVLQQLIQKTPHTYWLNPESKTKWNKGDSVIHKYASFCKGVYETRTLNSLLTALEDIVNVTAAQK